MSANTKQFISILVIILVIVLGFIFLAKSQNMIVVQDGNINKTPYQLTVGKYQDSDCGMVINDMEYVSQVVSNNGQTWFFHDHGGMVHWLLTKDFKESAIVWVMTKDTHKYIDGRKAWYSRTDITPMKYGFGAYEYKQDGFVDFPTMSLHMARGEHLGNPQIRAKLLGNQ